MRVARQPAWHSPQLQWPFAAPPTHVCRLTEQELSSGGEAAETLLGICASFEGFVREGMESVVIQQHQMGE